MTPLMEQTLQMMACGRGFPVGRRTDPTHDEIGARTAQALEVRGLIASVWSTPGSGREVIITAKGRRLADRLLDLYHERTDA